MRGFGLLKSLVGIVKKPKPVDPVDQAFDNIVKGKLDDVATKVTNFYQHPPPCHQCGAKFVSWEQRDGHFFFGGCARPTGEFDSAAVAKRVRAEVNKLSPEEKERYLQVAQQMAASADQNRLERKLGEMSYELRNMEHIIRLHFQVFGESKRCIAMNIALQEVRSAVMACDNARSWASDEWKKVNQPEEWAKWKAYQKEQSDAACRSTHEAVDPAVLSAIDQTP
jgi:hypothetical protein